MTPGTVPKDHCLRAFDGGWITASDVAAGGLYRVASCEAKKKAVVQVFIGSLKPQRRTVHRRLVFADRPDGAELGWRLEDHGRSPSFDDPDFGGRVKDAGPSERRTTEDHREIPDYWIELVNWLYSRATAREGWVEYANAKR